MRALLLLVAVLALSAACAPAEVSVAGAKVAVLAAPRAGCTRVGPVQASAGYNGRSSEANVAGVEATLRNEAALRGGDTLVITSRQLGAMPTDWGARGAMVSGGCPNCVAMTADVHRCPAGAAPPAVVTQVAPATADAFGAAAAAALAAAGESARRCLPAGSAGATAEVRVTFGATGDVVYAEVEGEAFQGTPLGACVGQKLRNMHVPPWSGEARSIQRALPLAP